jgi:transcriptional regulator with XRE-family HTH domain
MALTKRQRKERLGRGAQKEIAEQLGVSNSLVSAVVNGKTQILGKETVARVQKAVAERIGESVEEVFGSSQAVVSKFGDRIEVYDPAAA